MELTFADLEVQNVELLPSREALGGFGLGGFGGFGRFGFAPFAFTPFAVTNVVATNTAVATFGSVATAAQVI